MRKYEWIIHGWEIARKCSMIVNAIRQMQSEKVFTGFEPLRPLAVQHASTAEASHGCCCLACLVQAWP